MTRWNVPWPAAALAVCVVMAATPAMAQVQTGTITGQVVDEQGAVLPGVTVTLQGATTGTQTFTTGQDGRYRFLNLSPGTYTVTAELTGFTRVERKELALTIGTELDVPVKLRVGPIAETVTVTGATPVIDRRVMGTGVTFTQDELSRVPNSRDPWALLRTVPGVMMDRVNIAGNETGQQSEFVGKGSRRVDASWTLDGVVITDVAATGASPSYFDYDAFEEIRIATSGQDIRQPTGGVGLNFVVKRGTNRFSGTARGYFTNNDLEWSNVPDELTARGITPASADHNDRISETGVDFGGPIVRDRLWFMGSFARQDIRLVRQAGNVVDRTVLDTSNVKLNWQITDNDMFNFLWFNGAKKKEGRATGNAQVEPLSATWRQDNNYPNESFPGLWKFENNRSFGRNLFLTTRYAYYGTGFSLVPMEGDQQQAGISTTLGQTFGSTQSNYFLRPQHTLNAEATYFLSGRNELKFGGGWRQSDSTTQVFWPGDMVVGFDNSTTDRRARIYREGFGTNRMQYLHAYVGDTLRFDRLTVDLGLRYDRQSGEALASESRANLAFPAVVPGIVFAGYQTPFTWQTLSPRAGATLSFHEGRTLLRASVSVFPGQLDSTVVGYINPTSAAGFVEYPWVDANGDHLVQPNEIVFGGAPLSFGGGFNPADPTAVASPNRFDPELAVNKTASVVVGVDRELARNLVLQVNYTHSRGWDYNFTPWAGVTSADYAAGPVTPEGVQTFIPNAALIAANGNARILTNWEGYSTRYHGIEASLVRRMADRWMMRVAGAWNHPTEHYDMDVPVNQLGNPTRRDTEPLLSGGQFAQRSAGSGQGDIFINGRWSLNVNGAVQLPWDMEVAGNLFGRDGNPYPHFRSVALGLDGSNRVLVTPELDTERFDTLWNLDLRWAKNVRMGRTSLQIIADAFNVLNANTELQRERNAASPNFGLLNQNLSPRIIRFGARFGF